MRYISKTLIAFGGLLLQVGTARGDIRITCPDGEPPYAGQSCVARGTLPSSGWLLVGYATTIPRRIEFSTSTWTFRFPGDSRLQSIVISQNSVDADLIGKEYANGFNRIISTEGVVVSRLPQSSYRIDPTTIFHDNFYITSFNSVVEGPAQTRCSMSGSLNYDFGTTPDPQSTASVVHTLPVRCTGTARGTLSLRGTSTGALPLGDSGVVATFSIKNRPLGGVLDFTSGVNNVPITSTLSGHTTQTGSLTGSGVLVLDLL